MNRNSRRRDWADVLESRGDQPQLCDCDGTSNKEIKIIIYEVTRVFIWLNILIYKTIIRA